MITEHLTRADKKPMIIRLTKNIKIRISKPFWIVLEPEPQLELQFQNSHPVKVPITPEGYTLRVYTPEDESQVISLLNSAGISFNPDKLKDALSICLPKGCFVIEHNKSRAIVAINSAQHLADDNHPFGGRIGWFATALEHRGLGLGKITVSSSTRRLQDAGYEDIRVTTDEARIGALKVFYRVGFRPVLYNGMEERWRKVYETLGLNSDSIKVLEKK